MRRRSTRSSVAVLLAVAVGLACGSAGVSAQTSAATAAERLSGTWRVNKSLSSKNDDIVAVAPGQNYMGITLLAQVRQVMRAFAEIPAELKIVATSADVTLSGGPSGDKYLVNNRAEPIILGRATAQSRTSWERNGVRQLIDVAKGELIYRRTWQVSNDGKQLTVTITQDSGTGREDFKTIKTVYDRQ